MKQTVGNRIKSARVLAGLSLRELADRMIGIVSHTAIKKYEDGLMMPDSKVIIALSNALNVKPDYFFRPYTVEIEKVEFRKKSRMHKKELNSIRENVTNSIERYIELEQFLNIPSTFNNPLKDFVINNGDDVEEAVNHLLTQWKLGFNALPNVIEMLEDKGVKVIELDTNEDFDGLSGWANGNIPIIVVNKNYTIDRKRFTALHELGHLLLSTAPSVEPNMEEKLCHRFAGAMLMPKETFIAEVGEYRTNISPPELIAIKETYGISIQAVMARAKDLEIITNETFVRFRIWLNQLPERKKEIGLGIFLGREHSSRFRQLLYRAASEEIISLSKAANLANKKLADFRDEFFAV
jgi:Zn-dependent peptidase ImmA (M78 family)